MQRREYEVIQVAENSWRIEEEGVRCFLFTGGETALLVDSGFGGKGLKEVVAGLTKQPVMLVNTHADRDHTGGNAAFGAAHLHPAEYDRYFDGASALPRRVAPLWEGDVIEAGGRRFAVLLIPGHTPGSIALLDEENRILMAGDSVQAGNIFMFGPGRSLPAYLSSMEKLAALSSRFDTVYPSHGPFPLEAEILQELIRGARRILAGEAKGTAADVHGAPVYVVDVGAARFLCPVPETGG